MHGNKNEMKNTFVLFALLLWFGNDLITKAQQESSRKDYSMVARLNDRRNKHRSIKTHVDESWKVSKTRVVNVALDTQVQKCRYTVGNCNF